MVSRSCRGRAPRRFTVPSQLPRTLGACAASHSPSSPPSSCSRRSRRRRPRRPTRRCSPGSEPGSTSTTRPPTGAPTDGGEDRRARGAHRLRRDRERPQRRRRRQPEGARAASSTRSRRVGSGSSVVPAGFRPAGARRPPHARDARIPHAAGAAFDGVALDIESLRLKSAGVADDEADRTQPDAPRRGRRCARRRDHVSLTRLRAPPDLVARVPLGAGDVARRRLDPDDVHGRRFQGLRRDLRLRRALAAPAPAAVGPDIPSMRRGASRTG